MPLVRPASMESSADYLVYFPGELCVARPQPAGPLRRSFAEFTLPAYVSSVAWLDLCLEPNAPELLLLPSASTDTVVVPGTLHACECVFRDEESPDRSHDIAVIA